MLEPSNILSVCLKVDQVASRGRIYQKNKGRAHPAHPIPAMVIALNIFNCIQTRGNCDILQLQVEIVSFILYSSLGGTPNWQIAPQGDLGEHPFCDALMAAPHPHDTDL